MPLQNLNPNPFYIIGRNGVLIGKNPITEENKIKPVIHTTIPLPEITEAHRISESGRAQGKIIMKIKD